MQKYYEISDAAAVEKIETSLLLSNKFDEKLYLVGDQYGADGYGVHNTLSNGKLFHHLWFFDETKIDKTLFKISKGKAMEGKPIFEARPRKTNKAFYTEFMNDLQHVDYADFTKTLFGQIVRYGADLSFIKRDDKYFISANYDIVLPHTELTASQYQSAMEKLEK
ncbi:hypothetical protein MKR65_05520 [Acinetobacter baumannii]